MMTRPFLPQSASTSNAEGVRIKFCGFTREADLNHAVQLGIDAVGFMMVPESLRSVTPRLALQLADCVPESVALVFVFANQDIEWVAEVLTSVPTAIPQFHGAESKAYCESFSRPYIKVLNPQAMSSEEIKGGYPDSLLMFDVPSLPHERVGAGTPFETAEIPAIERPWMLAGSLNAENVAVRISALKPWAVDVSRGIEEAPGIKDWRLMETFVQSVRSADES